MTVHAFVDESCARDQYLLPVALVDPADLAAGRRFLRGLLLSGQRELHCKKEKPARRRQLADLLVAQGFQVTVYQTGCAADMEAARQRCLQRAAGDLLAAGARRIVLDSREGRDRFDDRTLRVALGRDRA